MQDKIQSRIMEILQSKVMPASNERTAMNLFNSGKLLNTLLDVLKAMHMKIKNCKHNA